MTQTTVQLLAEAWKRADDALSASTQNAAKREYALAKTAVEDAIMRFNRGQAEDRGTRRDFDFEVQE